MPDNFVLMIATTQLGDGDERLGATLMRSFLKTQAKAPRLPDTIVLLNEGVKLVVEDSVVKEDFSALVERGVELLVCGTCLDFYELRDDIRVGTISNMFDIVTALNTADRFVRI